MSGIHDLQHFIQGHPFSEGMSDEHIKLLTGCAKNVHFEEGAFLFREGEEAETFYCIRSGNVALELHAPPRGTIQIDSRTAGETLGWSWIVSPYRWFCDARAVGKSGGWHSMQTVCVTNGTRTRNSPTRCTSDLSP